jgi:hypothetical protein
MEEAEGDVAQPELNRPDGFPVFGSRRSFIGLLSKPRAPTVRKVRTVPSTVDLLGDQLTANVPELCGSRDLV